MADQPYPCLSCEAPDKMAPRIMRPAGTDTFIRWFCECGASSPDSVLRRHAERET